MHEDYLPEGFNYVPEGSGWFGYSSALESIERHDITWGKYHEMLNEQQGCCAICDRHQTSVGPLVVDHDHSSDKVRRLLCQRCNCALGLLDDDPHLFGKAASYLVTEGCWATNLDAEHPGVVRERLLAERATSAIADMGAPFVPE
jgi:hypothetical protein